MNQTPDFDILKVRSKFPALHQKVYGNPLVYLDSAASALKPKVVIDAITHHYTFETANVHRGIHFLSEQGTIKYEQTRKTVQAFINAGSEKEIIFTKGTTEAINLVAHSFGEAYIQKDDVILVSTMEHHSNIVPWQLIAEKKAAKVIPIAINEAGEICQQNYKELLQKHPVKIVAVTHISNTLGTINPIKSMIKLAHENGAKFLVDAAQSIPHMPVDVKDLNCDFLAFSGHKVFGPTGVGILYGKENLLDTMPPYQGGGAMIKKVSFEKTTFNDLPEKFEAGTPAIAEIIALKNAIDFTQSLNFNSLMAYEQELMSYAKQSLQKISGLKIIGNANDHASVFSFIIKDAHHHDIGTLLDKQGIAVRTGHHCTQPLMDFYNITGTIRASFCIYNTKTEVDVLCQALNKCLELL